MNLLYNLIMCPDKKIFLKGQFENKIFFTDDSELQHINGVPILLSKKSLFKIEDLILNKPTTQNKNYNRGIKAFFRKRILPDLTQDNKIKIRYLNLSKRLKENSTILIVGVGDKKNELSDLFFGHNLVFTTPVQNVFLPATPLPM